MRKMRFVSGDHMRNFSARTRLAASVHVPSTPHRASAYRGGFIVLSLIDEGIKPTSRP